MKITPICLALCALGALLIIAGSIWTNAAADKIVWTEEQAQKHNEIGAKFHQAAHAHGAHAGHNHGDADQTVTAAELAVAEKAWKEDQAKLEAAIARRSFWSRLLYRSGMGAIILGGVGYLIAKNVMEDQD